MAGSDLGVVRKLQRRGKHPPLYGQLRDHLRNAILEGRLRPEQRLPTELELARHFRVSPVTAGRALAELSQEGLVIRRRKLGTYVAGPRARRRAGGGMMVAIVLSAVSDAAHPFAGSIVRGAERVLHGRGVSVCLVASNDFADRQRALPFAIPRDRTVAGAIVVTEQAAPQEGRHLLQQMPTVFLQTSRLIDGATGVRVDFCTAMIQVVEHLADLGHKAIALVMGPRDSLHPSVAEARDAALTRIRALGLTSREQWVLHGRYSVEAGRAMCERLLKLQNRPSAVICGDDFLAAGVLEAARHRGVSVPGGLSIVGMNDMPIATMLTPALTSVAVPAEELGTRLAEMLLDRIDGRVSSCEVMITPRLIVRESTGPPRRQA